MFTESTHMGPVWATKTTFLRLAVPVAHMTHPHKPLKLLNNCWWALISYQHPSTLQQPSDGDSCPLQLQIGQSG